MVLEVFGLGILLPVLDILLDEQKLNDYTVVNNIVNNLNLDYFSMRLYLLIGLMVFYFFRSAFLIGMVYYKNLVLANLTYETGNKMIYNYLNAKYSFHVDNSSSKLLKNFQVELNFFMEFIHSLLTLITESMIAFSIIITLIYLEPYPTLLTILVISFFVFLLIFFVRKPIRDWGKARGDFDNILTKLVSESLVSIRELKIFQKENYYFQRFKHFNKTKASIISNQKTLSEVPRYYFEFIAVLGMLFFVLFLILGGNEINSVLIKISVFLVGIFRILPSVNRIVGAYQKLSFYMPSYKIIEKETKNEVESRNAAVSSETSVYSHSIKFENVSFRYDSKNQILKEINLEIFKGEKIGVIGESGSGKSTLIDLLIGLIQPTQGNILIDNQPLNENTRSWTNLIGYVPQSIMLIDESIKKNIAFGTNDDDINKEALANALKAVSLDTYFRRNEIDIEKKIGERGVKLSGGQIQRIGIARALYKNPKILILDEATSALDKSTEDKIIDEIYALPKDITTIIISHRTEILKRCDKIFSIKNKGITIKNKV